MIEERRAFRGAAPPLSASKCVSVLPPVPAPPGASSVFEGPLGREVGASTGVPDWPSAGWIMSKVEREVGSDVRVAGHRRWWEALICPLVCYEGVSRYPIYKLFL